MKSASEELKKLRQIAEKSLLKTDELDKLLSQVEVIIQRNEAKRFRENNKLINNRRGY
tara:strand:- start:360 stop:533 length:174 start_codon:yes stop_codon:yes gene_type:complete